MLKSKLFKTFAVAKNTIDEILKHKILNLVLIYVITNIIVLLWVTQLVPGAESRVIIDTGFASLEILSFLTVLLGVSQLTYEENELRTVWLVLVKPIKRTEFLIGKFIGVAGILFANTILMSVFLLLSCFIGGSLIDWSFLVVVYFLILEMFILTSISMIFSELSSNLTTSIAFTSFIFILGHISHNLKILAGNTEVLFFKIAAYIFYYIIPNLEYFNLKDKLYALLSPISFYYIFKVTIYSIVYTSFGILISNAIFNRKELK